MYSIVQPAATCHGSTPDGLGNETRLSLAAGPNWGYAAKLLMQFTLNHLYAKLEGRVPRLPHLLSLVR